MKPGIPLLPALAAGTLWLGAAPPGPHVRAREAVWIRPARRPGAEPVWGIQGGIQIGLWPAPGPRGLFRIYAPCIGVEPPQVLNFVSVEPVVARRRGQSELERSAAAGQPGLEFAALDAPGRPAAEPRVPSAGRIARVDGVEALTFWVQVERFANGARPLIQVVLRRDRPREVAFRVHSGQGGAPMDSCVLSATMGNYARLRRLWLRGEVVDSRRLWPAFTPDRLGFAPWRQWPRDRLLLIGGERLVAATGDESDPSAAAYEPAVAAHWRYQGRSATQYWRTPDAAGLVVRVNGRTTYWGSGGTIPGGVAYENFELEAPFRAGQEFRFGITPDPPEALGFPAEWGLAITNGQ